MGVVFSSDVVASEEYKRKLEERLDAIEKRIGVLEAPSEPDAEQPEEAA